MEKSRKRRTTSQITSAKRTKSDESKQHHKNLLQEITVTNFMCHKELKLNFGERVNFIVGQNGSGKSACLNAIQVMIQNDSN